MRTETLFMGASGNVGCLTRKVSLTSGLTMTLKITTQAEAFIVPHIEMHSDLQEPKQTLHTERQNMTAGKICTLL